MSRATQYATLICSLPAYEKLFTVKQTPISRIQLERRLSQLQPNDATDIKILGQLLDWFRHPIERTDAQLLTLIKAQLPQVHSPSIRGYIEWRLAFRSVVAALREKYRSQQLGSRNMPANDAWGYGRWVPHINKHWHEPHLGLEKLLPWVVGVSQLLAQENATALEKLLLSLIWRWLDQQAFGHEFDLEAIAIYCMRWDIVARWSSYESTLAEQQFQQLLNAALKPVRNDTVNKKFE